MGKRCYEYNIKAALQFHLTLSEILFWTLVQIQTQTLFNTSYTDDLSLSYWQHTSSQTEYHRTEKKLNVMYAKMVNISYLQRAIFSIGNNELGNMFAHKFWLAQKLNKVHGLQAPIHNVNLVLSYAGN